MKTSAVLSICLLSIVAVPTFAQHRESINLSRYTFGLSRILLKNGSMKDGWLLGTCGDTLVVQIGNRSERIPRTDILRISIEPERSTSGPIAAGLLTGAYAANILLLKADGQPSLFMRDEGGPWLPLLCTALAGLVGGGIGYFAGSHRSDRMFDFSGSDEECQESWQSLADGRRSTGNDKPFSFSFQGAWIRGALPTPDGVNSYRFNNDRTKALSLNLIRRMQVALSLTDHLDVGVASLQLGQPSIGIERSSRSYAMGTTVSLEGSGLYLVGVLQPLGKSRWRSVQWDLGAGVGSASIDFRTEPVVLWRSITDPPLEEPIRIRRTGISVLLYTELKVFLEEYLTLGIVADWAWVPQDVPQVEGVRFNSTRLGTSSLGWVLGFHF